MSQSGGTLVTSSASFEGLEVEEGLFFKRRQITSHLYNHPSSSLQSSYNPIISHPFPGRIRLIKLLVFCDCYILNSRLQPHLLAESSRTNSQPLSAFAAKRRERRGNEVCISEDKSGWYYFSNPEIAHQWARWTQLLIGEIEPITGVCLPDYTMLESVC